MLMLTACTSVPLKQGDTLTSYDSLGPSKGMLGKRRTYVDGAGLKPLATALVVPTSYTSEASSRVQSEADRRLVANALDRALCVALSDRYRMVPPGQPADLIVRSVITDIVPTNKTLAGASTVVSLGTDIAGVPVPVPRIPFGLGGIAIEAEAIDRTGVQRAATLWARRANSLTSDPLYSEVGDAYGLAAKFGSDFSQLLVKGREGKPLEVSIPSRQRLQSWFGGKPKYAACETFGRSPGLVGKIASNFGAPPQWTDRKSKVNAPATARPSREVAQAESRRTR
ncbi:hypothetical protein M673_04200 [Aureimonas sp. AU20]|nr:hypothetical protein M673_04200 [Aureimonas sp. AU20]